MNEMRTLRALLLFWFGVLTVGGAACRHDCSVAGAPQAYFSVASCCTGQSQYYWNHAAKDCVSLGSQKCGCVCDGKDCDWVFLSLEACRAEYAHCR